MLSDVYLLVALLKYYVLEAESSQQLVAQFFKI
jgi:hypothetical protein